jgi:hypothetical protein
MEVFIEALGNNELINVIYADSGGRAVSGVGLQLLDCGFETR